MLAFDENFYSYGLFAMHGHLIIDKIGHSNSEHEVTFRKLIGLIYSQTPKPAKVNDYIIYILTQRYEISNAILLPCGFAYFSYLSAR